MTWAKFEDAQRQLIRLPDERWQHICINHPEMTTMLRNVCGTLKQPDATTMPDDDPDTVRSYYKWFTGTVAGDKWVRVVVKYLPDDAFVLTAFLTNRVK